MKQPKKARAGPTNIAIVGAGGIGSALTNLLVRSLHDGGLARKIGGTRITLFDSDIVEQRNTLFQLFRHQDVGQAQGLRLLVRHQPGQDTATKKQWQSD